jgi:hypothetical protein
LFPSSCQLSYLSGQRVEGRLNFAGKGLAKDLPMLGLGRAALPRRATFQTSDQIVVQIPHMQVSGHPTSSEIIVINDLKWR